MNYEFLLNEPLEFKVVGDEHFPLSAISKKENLKVFLRINDWYGGPRFTLVVAEKTEIIDDKIQYRLTDLANLEDSADFPIWWSIPIFFELRNMFWVGLLGSKIKIIE